MSIQVKLSDIIEEMEMQFDESRTFLYTKTGEIVTVADEELRIVEEYESFVDIPEWRQDVLKVANDVFENFDDYIELPTKFDINEYQTMEDFCFSINDLSKREIFLRSIKGRGAFRRFRNKLLDFDMEQQWYIFRDEHMKQIAKEWCEGHRVDYIDE